MILWERICAMLNSFFFFSSRRRHTRCSRDWSSDVCSSDLLGNNNAHITVPVLHKPGRGLNFNYDLSYDSSVWYPVGSSGNQTWQPVSYWGWSGVTQAVTGTLTNSGTDYTCQMCNQYTCWYPVGQAVITNWVYHDHW